MYRRTVDVAIYYPVWMRSFNLLHHKNIHCRHQRHYLCNSFNNTATNCVVMEIRSVRFNGLDKASNCLSVIYLLATVFCVNPFINCLWKSYCVNFQYLLVMCESIQPLTPSIHFWQQIVFPWNLEGFLTWFWQLWGMLGLLGNVTCVSV